MSRDSSVGMAPRYGTDDPGIESGGGLRFSEPVQTDPGAHPASYTMDTRSFLGVKRPGRGVDHPLPSSADVNERVELYLYFTSGPSVACYRVNFYIIYKQPTKCTSKFKKYFIYNFLSNTSIYYRVKTHHITASSITPHRLNNFNSKDLNRYQFVTYICITYVILTEIITIFNCYGMKATHLTTFVPLYSCNNIILKMAALAVETCW